ncbi:hypothetical protein [Methanosalsum natronophilum]|uniref:hypothetical protein n=1 Tax=Methanosalsum natronophilum TaxID=768733 RepID=UPI00216728F0|nr:hypothetical protein [Methanosalsum natronophilum]MCS3923908.1 TM2 domain-containing membrane protein YozV [Methanosalsum natronophilum]
MDELKVDEMYCHSCGHNIKKEAEICPDCGVRQKHFTGYKHKEPAFAAVLSFLVTGLGQVYNGEIGKGLLLFFVQIFNILLMFILIGVFTYLAVWVYSIYDAYNTAENINNSSFNR